MKLLTLAALLALSLTACLKDKSAEEAPAEQTLEQPADTTATEAAPTEAAPADAGTTETK